MRSLLIILLAFTTARAAEPPFEILAGDRVLFLGDALLEREGTYGYLETRMHEQFADRSFTVRNLSYAGDTPLGVSRASFDPPAKGWERLREQLELVRPTVVFLGFGMAASLQEITDKSGDATLNPDPARYGAEPMSAARFKRELGTLMEAIEKGAAGYLTAEAQRTQRGAEGEKKGTEAASPAAPNPSADLSKTSAPLRSEKVAAPGGRVRFVLLSPIRHEDLRASRPGLPDPAAHNKLLAEYAKAIEELAKERGARFVNLSNVTNTLEAHIQDAATAAKLSKTDNGIHLNAMGCRFLVLPVLTELKWALTESELAATKVAATGEKERIAASAALDSHREALRAAIIRKNELFFHRWRPANWTYIFGFRKDEQGRNARELPMFDPLVAAAEAEIERLKKAALKTPENVAGKVTATTEPVSVPATAVDAPAPLPLPKFTVADGYQIELWAQNPMLEKPTQMNWDALGRLWVCSSSLYPMIAPGQVADDKILILSDPTGSGKATKSEVFVRGLLIPTGVVPDLGKDEGGRMKDEKQNSDLQPSAFSPQPYGCYIGQSTELLHIDAAGRRRIILSGFGTEDSHHIIHTLRWGPDGRLYFNQSIYIHSHLETPWGMVRLNSGGCLSYDPCTERTEVFAKGWVNSWGHAWDRWGQSFFTDGAGGEGINWAFPGATFVTYERARQIVPSVSPGSYPKFCGLELIYSPHFPADWQGNAVTCDFRAHRIVRFGITDLAAGKDEGGRMKDEGKGAAAPAGTTPPPATGGQTPSSLSLHPSSLSSGYLTQQMPDLVRTADASFRPIDVKLGPDGALYVADWSNPVINHGEVDFRDPRRDHHSGRIWRISKKDTPPLKWEPLVGKTDFALADRFLSPSLWEREQTVRIMHMRGEAVISINPILSIDPDRGLSTETLEKILRDDPSPRHRLEAMRALARIPTARSAELVLDAAVGDFTAEAQRTQRGAEDGKQTAGAPSPTTQNPSATLSKTSAPLRSNEADVFYQHAAWLSINELAKPWTDAIASGAWKAEGREAQLEFGLKALPPDLSRATLARVLAEGKVDLAKGPWIDLISHSGGPDDLRRLFDMLLVSYGTECCPDQAIEALKATPVNDATALRIVAALLESARVRNVRPSGNLETLERLVVHTQGAVRAGVVRLVGWWKPDRGLRWLETALPVSPLRESPLDPALVQNAIESMRDIGGAQAIASLKKYTTGGLGPTHRQQAAAALAALDLGGSLPEIAAAISAAPTEDAALAAWRDVFKIKGAVETVSARLSTEPWGKTLAKPAAAAGLRAAREAGKKGEPLAAAFAVLAGLAETAGKAPADFAAMAALVKKHGDPARGELVYRRATSGCVTCHAIGGAGGTVGPALTSLGASAPLDYIVESVYEPNAKVKEGYHAVTLTLQDGTEITGIDTRETERERFVRNVAGQEIAVVKENLTGQAYVGSLMPAGLLDQYPERDRWDLLAFLGELGKPGPFDASKPQVARVWRIYPGTAKNAALKGEPNDATANVLTLVDGRLLKEHLAEALQLVTKPGAVIYAVTQFQSTGKTFLELMGQGQTWIDGQPFMGPNVPELRTQPVARSINLPAGLHTLAVELDVPALPPALRAASADASFITN